MTDESASKLNSDEVKRLHEENSESLRRYLVGITGNNEDAEDCLQSTFAILQQKGGSCAEGSRRAWLFRVAYNEAMQLFRRRKTSSSDKSDELIGQTTDPNATPEEHAIRDERFEQVRQAVEKLPIELQQIVRLRINEGLRFREVAEHLKIPLGTALARMQLALKKLNEKLSDE